LSNVVKTEKGPYKLTPELTVRVCKALRMGMDLERVLDVEGISRATFYQWRKLGRDGAEPYATFLAQTEDAFLNVELALHGTVLNEALGQKKKGTEEYSRKPNWKAAAWMIRWRASGGGKQRVELTGKDGEPLQAGVTHALTADSADAIRRKILFGDKARPVEEPSAELEESNEP
jgi:hypothetical protein